MRRPCGIMCAVLTLLLVGCGKGDAEKPEAEQGDLRPAAAASPAQPAAPSEADVGDRRDDQPAATDLDAPGEQPEEAETLDAEQVLAGALSQAGSEGKRVLVHLGAPW